MRKQLVLFSVLTLSCISIYAQSVTGGAGITHVDGDPDNIVLTQGVDIYESNICYDPRNQIMYFFNPAGTAGVDQWSPVSVGSFTNTDTRLNNPVVSNDTLYFDVYDVVSGTNTGQKVKVALLSVAPVQSVVGAGDISVSNLDGTYTVSFTEAITALSIDNDTLKYTDEDGTLNKVFLPTSDGSNTDVQGRDDISVTGTGTTADPYLVSFTEANTVLTIDNDTLKYTDENGTLNKVFLPTSDGSNTDVQGRDDISVTGTGTTADPYLVSFTEANTVLTIDNDTLKYTDENGTLNRVFLPTSDGSNTDVQGRDDISVTGTGTTADPYLVSFTEANTVLTIDNDTLKYTDENGTLNRVFLPTSDGSNTDVQGRDDISVTGTGTTADPYLVSFTEANTVLTIDNDTLKYTDENGTLNRVFLPTSDGSNTDVQGRDDISVSGTGTTADPYLVSFTETTTSLSYSADTLRYTDEDGLLTKLAFSPAVSVDDGRTVDFSTSGTDGQTITAEITGARTATTGQFPISNGDGTITWSNSSIRSIATDSNGRLIATLTSGATVMFDLSDAPRVDDMDDLETAAGALLSGETGIAVSNDGNNLGLPSQETAAIEIGVIFFIRKK